MSVEFSAVCPEAPSPEVVQRLTKLLVELALDADVPVTVAEHALGVDFRLGSVAGTLLTTAAPGTHEFADAFVLTADDRDRTPESRLLALVVVLAAALVSGGRLLNEDGLLRATGLREVTAALLAGAQGGAVAVVGRLMAQLPGGDGAR